MLYIRSPELIHFAELKLCTSLPTSYFSFPIVLASHHSTLCFYDFLFFILTFIFKHLFVFLFIYLRLTMLGLCCCMQALQWVGATLCCPAWAVGTQASAVAAHGLQELRCMGLVVPWHVGSSQTRDWTCVPCVGRQILNHCTIRETWVWLF